MTSGNQSRQGADYAGTSLEHYLTMNEKEKDVEIQQAIGRLQTRIQKILYAVEAESGLDDGLKALPKKH